MILGKKKRRRALALITACQIIAEREVRDVDSFSHMTESLSELAFAVGGIDGIDFVKRELESYWRSKSTGNEPIGISEQMERGAE